MNNEIYDDLYNEKYYEYINRFIEDKLKKNPLLLKDYEILEVEYDIDGSKKDIYKLASERDIKNMQKESDKNELDFKFSQNQISKDEYKSKIKEIEDKIKKQNLLYDDLIFDIINTCDIDDVKKSIESYKLNNIDLGRLASAVGAVAENKINEFRLNNKSFIIDKVSYWNYKYNKISKGLSKAREVESFILSLASTN